MCQIRVNLRRWACLLAALTCLLALPPLPAHAAGAASKVVRVGWYEDAYNITGKNGERSGYAYEYEQSVAAYTGWTYEYVKAGWSDLLQMMKSGEIDLMAGVSYTEDRAQDMLFSELPMGQEIYYLYADLAHTDISASDLRTLNGKRIALLKTSVQAAQFYQWEEDHGLHLQYVWSNSFEQGKQQAQGREIDCVISTETPAWVEYGMSAIAQTGGSDIYFAISRTRQDLKEELDHAMRKMEFDKPFYADELYQRYLSASYTPVLSSEEQDWVTQHGDIRIGFPTSDAGISTYVPESGQLVGVINDYITFASDSISNQKLDFSLVGYDSMEEEIQALKDGQIDLIFHFAQNPYVAEENNFVLSNTVLTLNMAAVTAQNYFNENHANTVALLKDDLLLKWYVSYCYPDWNIVEYNSLKDAEAAMRSGENDCLLAESGEVAKYREDKRLHSVFLTQDGNVSFAVARGDVTLMSILNKTLRTIPASMLTGALPMYEASLEKVTVTDFVKDNFLVVSVMLITFFGMILAVILVSLRRSRIAEANAKEAARQARKLNQKLQESQRELRAALQQAESASSAKTTFLSNVSHDIRTPMNAIVGLASLMENDLQNPGKLQGYIDKLKTASWHLLNLINEILDMSKIESGKATLNIQPFRMAEQIAQVDSVIRQQAVLRDQQFTVQVHDLLHENVEGDATRLRQVLLNILSNAVKYTQQGGEISFDVREVSRSGHSYVKYAFVVKDNGIGMTEEFQKHLFDVFTRAEDSVTNKVQGTGLGMAITKSIVDMMGGVINVESAPGEGSCFEVLLEFKVDAQADDRAHTVQDCHLLLVGYAPGRVADVQDALEHTPVTAEAVERPEDAVSILRQEDVDVVLLSCQYRAPEMLRPLVRQMREAAGKPIFVFCMQAGQREEMLDIISTCGLDGFVPLPFFLSNLENEMAKLRTEFGNIGNVDGTSVLNGMRLLCAEDNPLNAEILEELLHMQGATCTIYSDGKQLVEAFDYVRPSDYDVILMDVQMPVMNGYDAAKKIRRMDDPQKAGIPIIAMTANAFEEDRKACLEAGMNEHIGKPIDIPRLKRAITKLLTKKG